MKLALYPKHRFYDELGMHDAERQLREAQKSVEREPPKILSLFIHYLAGLALVAYSFWWLLQFLGNWQEEEESQVLQLTRLQEANSSSKGG